MDGVFKVRRLLLTEQLHLLPMDVHIVESKLDSACDQGMALEFPHITAVPARFVCRRSGQGMRLACSP